MISVVYHYSRHKIDVFQPFSHFGTYAAAFDRWVQKHLLACHDDDETYFGGDVYYPILLDIKKPLMVDDDYSWDRTIITADCLRKLTAADRSYIDQPTNHNLSDHDICKELHQGELYPVSDDMDLNRDNLIRQRMVAILEDYGFDGLAYLNRDEDSGSVSWVNFRPQQVTSAISGPFISGIAKPLPLPALLKINPSRALKKLAFKTENADRAFSARMVTKPDRLEGIKNTVDGYIQRLALKQRVEESHFRARIEIAGMREDEARANSHEGFYSLYLDSKAEMIELAQAEPRTVDILKRPYLEEIRAKFLPAPESVQSAPYPP